ncbi:hypothetical protein F3Y22_tig00116964pilonHSYRG00172 [Hibiscus syriacus]|uniref:Serine-threonine/tyrosine-protein kinase catalytic domain-containing protein n=1 Tax=Hibiscus syriacus TaxID=106335 RepID=A0A6A2WVF9_HIBSY|nr:hypothetical protein F3Y22_tig00116964pilonHSYRG00172 [Hibiscus syriacus]
MPITSKVDVYSYGIALLELVTGRSPSMGVHGIDGKKVMQRTLSQWVKGQQNRYNRNMDGNDSKPNIGGEIRRG